MFAFKIDVFFALKKLMLRIIMNIDCVRKRKLVSSVYAFEELP